MSYLAVFLVFTNLLTMAIDGEPKISWLAIIILYFSPLLSSLLQLGLSRTREYDADLEAAQLTGNPSWLASALQRLERHTGVFWEDLTMPVPGRRVPQPSVLRSHPNDQGPGRAPARTRRPHHRAAHSHPRGAVRVDGQCQPHRNAPALPLPGHLVLSTPVRDIAPGTLVSDLVGR